MREIIDAFEFIAVKQARESFWKFRVYLHPKLKLNWFQKEVSLELETFYNDYLEGKRPQLVIQAPPQHGKSTIINDFIIWIIGKDSENPSSELKIIYAAFSDSLSTRANRRIQRYISSNEFLKVFPKFKAISPINQNLISYGQDGYFLNTTTNGAITGLELSIGVIDDPVKGREAANSKTIRNKTWDWFVSDFSTRFDENGALLAILTRWHIDDVIGRLIENDKTVKVLKYAAIAEQDEAHRKAGDALFPSHKSIDFLNKIKQRMSTADWQSLYQQNPILPGGNVIQGEWFKRYTSLPTLEYRMIYADTAQKVKEANDYSVFQIWGKEKGFNRIYLLDQIRGKWEAPELKRRAVAFWGKHKSSEFAYDLFGDLRKMKIEDKSSGTGLIQQIKEDGIIQVDAIQRNIDKYTRVSDALPSIEAGFVFIPDSAPFTNDYIAEFEAFTADDSHMHDDQIDPTCDAIKDMIGSSSLRIWERLGENDLYQNYNAQRHYG